MPETFAHSEHHCKPLVRYLRRAFADGVCYEARMKVRIKELRTAKKLTVEQLASALGMSKSYVSELENGRKEINGRRLEAFAKFFGVQVPDLISDPDVKADLFDHLAVVKMLSEEDKLAVQRHALSLLRAQEKK